jgi:signal peptidase I
MSDEVQPARPGQGGASSTAASVGRSRWRIAALLGLGALVLVATATRVLYEPYKIPSSAMNPTLRARDHIFVSTFAYGAGELPERGDVVVFRYPLKESEDFIKRVIGLPGDTVRVHGPSLAIRRRGATEFEEVAREASAEPCLDETNTRPVQGCTVYTEAIDGRTYQVQYVTRPEPDAPQPEPHTFEIPDGQFFVLGDNRNRSHDSPAWVDDSGIARPFVPLDNLKGRAVRIWLPSSRFWRPI